MPVLGLRRQTAPSSARSVRSVVLRGWADQPTTRRENRSITTDRDSQPSWILKIVMLLAIVPGPIAPGAALGADRGGDARKACRMGPTVLRAGLTPVTQIVGKLGTAVDLATPGPGLPDHTLAGDKCLLAAIARDLRRLARNLAASAPPGAMAPA